MIRFFKDPGHGQEFKHRLLVFAGIPVFFFTLFIVVLFSLQIIQGNQYAQRARKNREQYSILPAIRGVILDRDGDDILAYNRRSFAINVVPQNLPQDEDEYENLIQRLSLLLRMPGNEILKRIKEQKYGEYGSIVLKNDVSFEDVAFLAEHNREFPGVYWKSKPLRLYPNGSTLSHVLGYVGMISEKEYYDLNEHGYNIESMIGKSGVEKVYDLELKGKDGHIRRIVDATNQVTSEIIDSGAEPVPGNNVVLTIDMRLQKIAEESMGDKMGALVVSRPVTGEILALVSSPRYNPNMFVNPTEKEFLKDLMLDQRKPFLNRAIQAQYPAGSIFKLVVSLAILEIGQIPPDRTFSCRGGYQLGNRYFSCWQNHGSSVDLYEAIAESCDSYFYQAALILGHRTLANYARRLGLGSTSGIDLLGEREGLIPDEEWKQEMRGDIWYEGDTLNMAIGQGFILVTPLQLNILTNVIANKGFVMEPHIVKQIYSAESGEVLFDRSPELLLDSEIEHEHFEFVLDGMRGVVTHGTAKWGGSVYTVETAGKTSTSEVAGAEHHAWYTAIAPYRSDDPSRVITVTAIVEHGGGGSAAAAPVVAEVIEAWFADCDLETARRNIWRKRAEKYRKNRNDEEEQAEAAGGSAQQSDGGTQQDGGTEGDGSQTGEGAGTTPQSGEDSGTEPGTQGAGE
jgi:penicillin-binding protein 2